MYILNRLKTKNCVDSNNKIVISSQLFLSNKHYQLYFTFIFLTTIQFVIFNIIRPMSFFTE